MICDLLIVRVTGGADCFPALLLQDFPGQIAADRILLQAVQIFVDFLCNGRREYAGIGSRIGNQFFLIEFLDNFQRLIRTYF